MQAQVLVITGAPLIKCIINERRNLQGYFTEPVKMVSILSELEAQSCVSIEEGRDLIRSVMATTFERDTAD